MIFKEKHSYLTQLQKYVDAQKAALDQLLHIEPPVFYSYPFDCSHILSESTKWKNDLMAMGLSNHVRVLYYFSIIEPYDPQQICTHLSKMKMGPGRSDRALPKVNLISDGSTNTLYVGMTNKSFLQRFDQHLGLGHKRTYGLNLLYWAAEMRLQLTLNFAIFQFDAPVYGQLEQLESFFHYSIKPLLGRAGR